MPLSCCGGHGNAKDRDQRLGSKHSRQMSRAARSGNDHAQAARFGGVGVFKEPVGSAMRADNARLMGNLERLQDFHGGGEDLVVALAAHYHAHQRLSAHSADYKGAQSPSRAGMLRELL